MPLEKRNIWVLGGTGFIGTSLVKYLAQNSENMLHLLVHKHIHYQSFEKFNTFSASLENFETQWMERYPPQIIFHLARIGGNNNFSRYFSSRWAMNANRRLISFLSGLESPPKIVYVSGSLMYGHQSMTSVTEHSDISPVSFARHYIRGELPFLDAQKKKILDIRFARPGWIIGPSSWFTGFYWKYYLKTGKIPLYGSGLQLMSVIHVDDCAGQIVNLAEHGLPMQNLNIFSGKAITQQLFAETLAQLLNTSVTNVPVKSLEKQFGKTISEAFEVSIPLATDYTELINQYKPKFDNIEAMLSNTLSLLKDH